jgi:hypothetical protein
MRVGAGEHLARQGQAALSEDLVDDAVRADVEETRHAMPARELAGRRAGRGLPDARRRHGVIHDDGHPAGVAHRDDVLQPAVRELQVDQHGHVDVTDHELAGRDLLASRGAREDLLDDVHAHCASRLA